MVSFCEVKQSNQLEIKHFVVTKQVVSGGKVFDLYNGNSHSNFGSDTEYLVSVLRVFPQPIHANIGPAPQLGQGSLPAHYYAQLFLPFVLHNPEMQFRQLNHK